jgi:transposase
MTERYVGIDLGIRTVHRAAVYDGAQRRGQPFPVRFSQEGWDELVRRGTEGAEGPSNFVLEPTGLAWLALSAYLVEQGQRVYQVPPLKSSQFRKFLRRHTKTDIVDAAALARAPQIDPEGVLPLRVPTAEQTTLRWLVRRRERFASVAAAQKRRVHALLTTVNPPLMAALGEDKFGVAARAFLRHFADPEKVVQLGEDKLREFWRQHSKGREAIETVPKVLEACRTTAATYRSLREKGRLPFDYPEAQVVLEAELDEMEHAEGEVEQLEARIAEAYAKADPARTLEQLPGVGLVIAPVLEAFLGDVTRFRNAPCLLSYCGLVPRKKQTGLSDQPMPITKTGDRLLRKYLFLAAEVARHNDPEFAAYYARRFKRGDHHERIVVALARKLAARVYALLMRREAARRAGREGGPASPARYELRTPEGKAVTKKEARDLIRTKFARKVAAPERDAHERRRRGAKAVAPASASEGPSENAPGGIAEPPATPVVAQPVPQRQPQPPPLPLRQGGWNSAADILAALAQRGDRRGGKVGE